MTAEIKPHIFFMGGCWWCGHRGGIPSVGNSPVQAFQRFHKYWIKN